jgi:hypothetical protein
MLGEDAKRAAKIEFGERLISGAFDKGCPLQPKLSRTPEKPPTREMITRALGL